MNQTFGSRLNPGFGLVFFILHPSSFIPSGRTPVQIEEDPIILIVTESSRTAHQTHRFATLDCWPDSKDAY
jgi:hypothetical protein